MSKAEVMQRYPNFPPQFILSYSELGELETIPSDYLNDNLKVIEKVNSNEYLYLFIAKKPAFPEQPWCDTIYEVAAICCDEKGQQNFDVGDALGYLVYYTVNAETDEIRRI